jgi:hypothetical protein
MGQMAKSRPGFSNVANAVFQRLPLSEMCCNDNVAATLREAMFR